MEIVLAKKQFEDLGYWPYKSEDFCTEYFNPIKNVIIGVNIRDCEFYAYRPLKNGEKEDVQISIREYDALEQLVIETKAKGGI